MKLQTDVSLYSLVFQLHSWTHILDTSRRVIDTLIFSKINSKQGIKLSFDKPWWFQTCLNITRPAVLRQYFGKEIKSDKDNKKSCERFTYGSGSGTGSVSMDPLKKIHAR